MAKKKDRKKYEVMETHYMIAKFFIQDKCAYCGDIPNALDHVPPISWAYSLGYKYMTEEEDAPFIKIPCCNECNSLLGAKNLFTVKERKQYIASSLRQRYRKIRENPIWDMEDIVELGDGLQKYVKNIADYRLHIERRIDWSESDVNIAYNISY